MEKLVSKLIEAINQADWKAHTVNVQVGQVSVRRDLTLSKHAVVSIGKDDATLISMEDITKKEVLLRKIEVLRKGWFSRFNKIRCA